MKRTYLLGLLGLLILGIFVTGCTTTNNQQQSTAQETTDLLSAPDFTLTTTTGKSISLESYLGNGKPTIIYFMASWCPTCAKNWPALEELHNNGNVNIVAVSIDPTDTAEVLNKLASENGLTFPMVPGNPQLMLDFGVKGQATTVGVNSEGNIVFIEAGEKSLAEFEVLIKQIESGTKVQEEPESTFKQAPDFTVTTITGETLSMQEFKESGKPTLVYFTASWCPVCAKNWPAINEVYPEYKDRVNFISISIDPTDTTEVMSKLAEDKGLNYPLVPGNPDIMVDFGVKSQATTVGVDAQGNIVFVKEKQALTADEYKELLDELLAR